MTIIKVARQVATQTQVENKTEAFETVYIVKGWFRKKVYLLEDGRLWEVPVETLKNTVELKEVLDEKDTI
jgi:hypothetical protein